MTYLMNTYARLPVSFVRGEGPYLFDEQQRRYLDAISGIGVCSLGHSHPAVAEAVADQARTLIHTANLARIPWQESLAEKLAQVSGMDKVFVANSGAEAVECAIKISRLIGHHRGIDQPRMIVTESSFHGRTLACISASGSKKARAGFEPLVEGFIHIPYGDSDAAEAAIAEHQGVVAIMVEPIQGEGGVRVPPAGYLRRLRELCDRHQLLLIADEIQCGMARSGRWFAYQHDDILPDIVTSAKALGNGIPIAACLARGDAATAFVPGNHGSTYGGNPLACRAACTVLQVMQEQSLPDHAAAIGQQMIAGFTKALQQQDGVVDIRGRGLMLGIELDRPAAEVRDLALQRGILLNVTAERVIRMLPPLIIDSAQANEIVDQVSAAIREFLSQPQAA
ncbi:MAG: aspartate aminotransferase family protein [Wenzhouxiangellaceae bacterium]